MQDRGGLEILSAQECERLLGSTEIGRVAFTHAGEVVILPVTFRFHRRRIFFRTGSGEKLQAAATQSQVAFEIDAWNAVRRGGWSVLVKGRSETVLDDDLLAELADIGLAPWAQSVTRNDVVQIVIEEVSGRRLPPQA